MLEGIRQRRAESLPRTCFRPCDRRLLKGIGEGTTPEATLEVAPEATLESRLQLSDKLIERTADGVEELVHEFRFLALGDVNDDFCSATGKPTGLGVSTSTTGKHEHADVARLHGLNVVVELADSFRVLQLSAILLRRPLHVVGSDVAPLETFVARRRVAKVVDLMTCLAQSSHHAFVVLIAPTAGNIDVMLCHRCLEMCVGDQSVWHEHQLLAQLPVYIEVAAFVVHGDVVDDIFAVEHAFQHTFIVLAGLLT